MNRFCGAEGIENVTVASGFRSSFGDDYGLTLTDTGMRGLLARAVVVIDEAGNVAYTELVPSIGQEPDYDAAVGCPRLTAASAPPRSLPERRSGVGRWGFVVLGPGDVDHPRGAEAVGDHAEVVAPHLPRQRHRHGSPLRQLGEVAAQLVDVVAAQD